MSCCFQKRIVKVFIEKFVNILLNTILVGCGNRYYIGSGFSNLLILFFYFKLLITKKKVFLVIIWKFSNQLNKKLFFFININNSNKPVPCGSRRFMLISIFDNITVSPSSV